MDCIEEEHRHPQGELTATNEAAVSGDGLPELLRTHFSKEYNTIHENLGGGLFEDRAPSYGVRT